MSRALELPAGQWIVAGVGAVVIAGAIYIGYRGLSQKFDERLDTSEMGPVTGATVDVLGTVGMVARSVVFTLAGYLLIRAAIDYDPDEASGLDGTLKTLAQATYGQVILAVTRRRPHRATASTRVRRPGTASSTQPGQAGSAAKRSTPLPSGSRKRGVALAPDRVPRLHVPVEPGGDHGRERVVDVGRAPAVEGERGARTAGRSGPPRVERPRWWRRDPTSA